MNIRNWIEIGITVGSTAILTIWKLIMGRRVSKLEGFGERNKDGAKKGRIME